MRILFRDQKRCVIEVLATKCRQWNEPLKRDINGTKKQTNKQIPKASSMNQVLFPFQANSGTQMWFRTYMWGIIYLRYVFKYIFLKKTGMPYIVGKGGDTKGHRDVIC